MTLFLASVRNEGEAALALAAGADVIDLKEPLRGALGAVTMETVRDCVRAVGRRSIVSATVGDVPLDAATLREAALQQHELGVDYVKLGVFPGDGAEEAMRGLDRLARQVQLIFVLFADALPDFDAVAVASRIGARGVMLDTMTKDGGSLLEHLTQERLSAFVVHARNEGLLVGLAGSLRASHVVPLLAIEPDLLGFRGALCRRHERGGTLDPEACSAIRALIGRLAPRVDKTARWRRCAGRVLKLNQAPRSRIRSVMAERKNLRPGHRDRVFVHDFVLDCEIGVYRNERGVTQRVRFSVDVELTPPPSAVEDNIDRTFDYDVIIKGIKGLVARGHISLVETLAEDVSDLCLAHPRTAAVTVRIEKLDKEPGAVGVEIYRVREE